MVKLSRPAGASERAHATKPPTSMSTITHKGRARGKTSQSNISSEKTKSHDQTQSSGFASDMSADECDEILTTPNNVQRSSLVHDFATKTSSNEYQCKLCTKVG